MVWCLFLGGIEFCLSFRREDFIGSICLLNMSKKIYLVFFCCFLLFVYLSVSVGGLGMGACGLDFLLFFCSFWGFWKFCVSVSGFRVGLIGLFVGFSRCVGWFRGVLERLVVFRKGVFLCMGLVGVVIILDESYWVCKGD